MHNNILLRIKNKIIYIKRTNIYIYILHPNIKAQKII